MDAKTRTAIYLDIATKIVTTITREILRHEVEDDLDATKIVVGSLVAAIDILEDNVHDIIPIAVLEVLATRMLGGDHITAGDIAEFARASGIRPSRGCVVEMKDYQ